jgi:hypothetical protein
MHPTYGIAVNPDGTLPWSWVQQQCEQARSYWVCTTRADGRPPPVWGLWLDDAVAFSTHPDTVKARNFSSRQDTVIHLDSGDDVVILEGRVTRLDESQHARFTDLYDDKYGYRPSPDQVGGGGFLLRPERVLAWREVDFATSATRFRA